MAALALSALHLGVRAYVARPVAPAWLWLAGGVLAWFAAREVLVALGAANMAAAYASGLIYAYLAAQCLPRLREHAGAAYGLAAAVLIGHPFLVLGVGVEVFHADLRALRSWAALGTALVGLGLLMAAMGRLRIELEQEVARRCQAEASLREANASLELRVRDRTAELQDLVHDLESFNHMVSHDLRGPLGGMKGLAEVCQQSLHAGDVERVARFLDVMQQEADRLGQLVSQLLELAKVTHAQLERHETERGDVLARALDSLRLSHGDAAVACVKVVPLPRATVDPVLLQQVFVNLVGNAIKFAGIRSQPEVRVRPGQEVGQIVVEVRDNGPGFSPEQAKELFQPFKRLHGKAYEGNGIGLTIVRRIIERHGGTVWAEGQAGVGASFFFSVPA